MHFTHLIYLNFSIEAILDFEFDDISISFESKEEFRKKRDLKRLLVSQNDTPEEVCTQAIHNMTQDLYSSPYDQMFAFSAKDVNDLGFPDRCRGIHTNPEFYIFSLSVAQLPIALRFGACLPRECSPEVMDKVFLKLSDTVNEVLRPILEDPPVKLPTDVIPVFKFEAVSSDQWHRDQRTRKSTPAYAFVGISVFFVLLVLLGNLFGTILHDLF